MCEKSPGCRAPEQLKGNPQDCSPEQIEKCHGGIEKHPCFSRSEKSISKHKDADKSAKP